MVSRLPALAFPLVIVSLGGCELTPPCPEQPPDPPPQQFHPAPEWIVQFDSGGTRLTRRSMAVLESFVHEVKSSRSRVWVSTYVDHRGEGGMAIRKLLMERGVDPIGIDIRLNSEKEPPKPPEPGDGGSRLAVLSGPRPPEPPVPKWPPEGYKWATMRCVATTKLLVREAQP